MGFEFHHNDMREDPRKQGLTNGQYKKAETILWLDNVMTVTRLTIVGMVVILCVVHWPCSFLCLHRILKCPFFVSLASALTTLVCIWYSKRLFSNTGIKWPAVFSQFLNVSQGYTQVRSFCPLTSLFLSLCFLYFSEFSK